MRTIDLLNLLQSYAQKYVTTGRESVVRNRHMNVLLEDEAPTRDQLEAVIVDFINYVGIQNGVDYAMYTQDLKGESK